MRYISHISIILSILSISLIIFGGACAVSGEELKNNSASADNIDERQASVDFFYNPTCEACERVFPIIQNYTKVHPDVLINFHNISESEDLQKLHNLKQVFHTDAIYVPIVVIGDTYLMGDKNITNSSIESAVNSYLKRNSSGKKSIDTTVQEKEQKNIETVVSAEDTDTLTSDNIPATSENISGIQFFYNPTCGSCQMVLPIIRDYAKTHPEISIGINDLSGNKKNIELFEQLSSRYPGENIHVPVVFIGNTLLEGEDNITSSFNSSVEAYLNGNYEKETLSQSSAGLITTINPFILLVAAIGEGVNPCGLLVLALLLVSLMATGTRKTVLYVGIAYICAFFIVRLLSGFAIFSVIQIPGLANAFMLVAALIAILAGLIQIKDGLSKKQKPLLSIPESKKSLISQNLKKASIPGGFIVGVLVGIYGMACTAGIYISILGMIYKDISSGLFYLVIYNIVVIIPLIIILLLVFFGIPPEKVNSWREERKSQLRLAIGIIMLIMGIIILIPQLNLL